MAIRYIVEIGSPVTHRFSSAVRNEINPTDASYPDDIGNRYNYPVRLAIPSIKSKISDAISGTTLLTQYNLQISNHDGIYDDVETLGWFNIPVVLKRCDKFNPTLDDFDTILTGELTYPTVKESSVTITINNTFRALTDEATNTFNLTDYPNVFDNVRDKNIPIGYGDQINVPLYRVDPSEFIALDKDYISAVSAVYDIDGNSITFNFDSITGQIHAIDATTADVTGRTNNKIGQIITTEMSEKAGILYDTDNWDVSETNEYILNDSRVNFYFSGGDVKLLVNNVLKNDNAFLFNKNDGSLTIRQWGRLYKQHTIEDWEIMKFPTKNYKEAQKYYNSSVRLNYAKDIKNLIYDNSIVVGDDTEFDKVKRNPFSVDLYETTALEDLGLRLIQRFGYLSEIITIYSGKSTYNMNLLDSIMLDVNINDRQFSTKQEWIIREVDPAQDILTLEARSGFEIPRVINGVLSQPMFNESDGILSQPFYDGIDGVLSQPIKVIE